MPEQVLVSLHGKQCGLSKGRKPSLIAPSFAAGIEGKQIAFPSPNKVAFFDDFLGDVIADQWNFVEGTDSTTTDAAVLAGGIGGLLRVTTGDAGTGLAADLAQLTQALQWQASNGDLAIEVRLKLSRITNAYLFVGFTDVVTLEAPIISAASGDTITTTATDAVGFMFDTRMSTDDIWLVGVANDVDATKQDSGEAPAAGTFITLRVEVNSDGDAEFFIDGAKIGSLMADAVTAATDLTPTIAVGNTSGTSSITCDIDYVSISMAR